MISLFISLFYIGICRIFHWLELNIFHICILAIEKWFYIILLNIIFYIYEFIVLLHRLSFILRLSY